MTWNIQRRSTAVQKQNLLGFDFGSTAFRAVHLRRIKNQLTVVGAALFPPVDLASESVSLPELPESFDAPYASLCVSHEQAAVRILTLSGTGDLSAQIREQFGPGTDARIAQFSITPPHVKPVRVLAAALPEKVVETCLDLFRSGPPALCNLEISGLSALSAGLFALGEDAAQGPLCLLDVGAKATIVFFMNRGAPVLIRKYDVGSDRFLEKVQGELNVDEATAIGVLHEGAVDVTQIFKGVMDSVIRQVVISRDFVERNEKCRIVKIHCSGAISATPFWRQMLRDVASMEVETWSPLDRLAVLPGAFPEECQGSETRFAAALGAALNVMGPA
jgi:Tfp pilus assembly PilM family ATPase